MTAPSGQRTVVVTGSTGLVGTKLVPALENEGWKVLRAVRRPVTHPDSELHWDPAAGKIDRDRLEGIDAVVHLAGANIAGRRWNEKYKQLLLDSRVQGTTLLSETTASLENKPKVFACASAIGFYGDRGDEELNEVSPSGDGFLPEVCMQWERCCQAARDAGIRVANMRIGVILSPAGGALAKMLLPFKMGGGGILGNGKQYFSWISLDDIIGSIQFVLNTESISGPVNLVAPQPVTNYEYTKTLGKVLSRPTILPMPAFAARLALGEMADALLLASTRVVPTVLQDQGYEFQHPNLEPALRYLLEK